MEAKEKLYKLLEQYEGANVLQNNPEEDFFPSDIKTWLSKLRLLYGVPVYYLVPDEKMLPPESIRFFHIDPNWVTALADGAMSIGRNYSKSDKNSLHYHSDTSLSSALHTEAKKTVTSIRAGYLGLPDIQSNDTLQRMSGFILRSDLVKDYPGLSVDAWDAHNSHLTILRMETLAKDSDLLICIFAGEISKVDIHEAPESLHYGFSIESGKPIKHARKFEKSESGQIKISDDKESVDLNACFRKDSTRILDIASLAKTIGDKIHMPLNAAEMGFVMTEGVGMVSFTNNKTGKE